VDIQHLEAAEDDDDPRCAVIDRLIEVLPKRNGKPYLAVFALTHADEDHCCGFAELLERVTIGELWHTPRVLAEAACDVCESAQAFRREAIRRVKKTIAANGNVASGDRIRVIGYDDSLQEDDYIVADHPILGLRRHPDLRT
jgi:hypothetical protein